MSRMKKIGLCVLIAAVIVLCFGAGYITGSSSQLAKGPGIDTINEVWQILHEEYVEPDKIDDGELSEAAIKGMLEALDDPYTAYLDAETFRDSINNLAGKFEGIGAYVGVRDEQIIVIAPIADSPAELAGIKTGDQILEIDGVSTEGMSLEEAVLKIRGPLGTVVSLLILHVEETEPVLIEIVRDEIEVPSVSFEMKEEVAYIAIAQFIETTAVELEPVMQSIAENGAKGIILDLRSNPGGLLDTVIDVAGYFLPDGVAVYVVDNEGNRQALNIRSEDLSTELPLVVLVDSYSASGSEVLAGILQDYGRATVAGATTFGKGSVNVLHPLKDGSGLYVTTGRWLTPDGHLIEGAGLEPDIELDLENEDPVQWAIDYLTAR